MKAVSFARRAIAEGGSPRTSARGYGLIIFVVLLFAGTVPALAAEPRLVGFIKLDTTQFGPTTAWLTPLIGVFNAVGLIPVEDQPIADGLLVASLMGTYPHQIALFDSGDPAPAPKRLRLVAQADAPGQFPVMRQALATVLNHYGRADQQEQVFFDLTDNRKAVRYRLDSWPAWLCLEWFADDKHFYIGVGTGALQLWMDHQQVLDRLAAPHRQAVTANQGDNVFLELFVDAQTLHETLGGELEQTKLARHWRLSRFGGAQQAMLHGRWAGTFLVLDQTILRDQVMLHEQLTLDHWPDEAAIPKPPGGFHIVVPIDWPRTVERVAQWADVKWRDEKTRQQCLDLAERFIPYALISDHPRPFLPLPGTATTYLLLRDDAALDQTRTQLDALIAPFMTDDDVSVAYDRQTDLHWLDSPLRRLIKAPAWGWADEQRVLIVSFSPSAVVHNRRWLDDHITTPAGE